MSAAAVEPGGNAVARVAIVDDHRMFLDGLRRSLEESETPIEVVAAVASWAELVRHLESRVDVVVLDLDLQDGVPAGVKIRTSLTAGAQVVMVSAFAEPAQVRTCLQHGASGYVPKSEPASAVAAAVLAASRGERYLTPSIATALLEDESGGRTPKLSTQEVRALTLYVSGLPLKSVARQMSVQYETAKSYLDRVRDKYASVGREARTKVELRTRAVEDGHFFERPPPPA